MTFERLHSDHEGDSWTDKESTRIEGYETERKKSEAELRKQDRINETARNFLKKLNKKPDSSIEPDEGFKLQ